MSKRIVHNAGCAATPMCYILLCTRSPAVNGTATHALSLFNRKCRRPRTKHADIYECAPTRKDVINNVANNPTPRLGSLHKHVDISALVESPSQLSRIAHVLSSHDAPAGDCFMPRRTYAVGTSAHPMCHHVWTSQPAWHPRKVGRLHRTARAKACA